MEPRPAEPRPVEQRAAEHRPAEHRPVEPRAAEPRAADRRPTESRTGMKRVPEHRVAESRVASPPTGDGRAAELRSDAPPPAPPADPRARARAAAEETARRASAERARSPAEPPPARPAPARPVVYTVSELQALLRGEVEQRFGVVLVGGEISNYHLNARSGHAYFTLKDDGAQMRCVMFRDNLIRIRHRLQDGLHVVARGRITIYEQGGQLQLMVQHVEPQGLGARQLELQERIEKLRKEGLTADARKRRLPVLPRCVGVVTSKSGAALRDVMRTILRRDPFAHVILAHAAVQGDGAASEIAEALRRLDALGRCEVIILCRGGGSTEDLWCFNEEPVARAIVSSRAPIVTGIGHETDTTVADLVADLRASTPTAAAEHAVPVRSEIRQRWLALESALHRALLAHTEGHGRRLLELSSRLEHPQLMLERRAQRIDELETRAERASKRHLARKVERLSRLERRLARLDPKAKLGKTRHRMELLFARVERALSRSLAHRRHRLGLAAGRLESLSPLGILSRGYALASREDGTLVKDASDVAIGEKLAVRLGRGTLDVEVLGRSGGDPNDNGSGGGDSP